MAIKINPIEDMLFNEPEKPEDLIIEPVKTAYIDKKLLTDYTFVVTNNRMVWQYLSCDNIKPYYDDYNNLTVHTFKESYEGIFVYYTNNDLGYMFVSEYDDHLMFSEGDNGYSVMSMAHILNFNLNFFADWKELFDFWKKMDYFKCLKYV